MEPLHDELTAQFVDAAVELGADRAAAVELAARLIEAWSEPHRRYHGLAHLRESVRVAVEATVAVGADVNVVIVALWFHDAIYDTSTRDSEERSARLARVELTACGVRESEIAEVERLVRATRSHRYEPDDRNAAVVIDADLAVLAWHPVEYLEYVAGVRFEYGVGDRVSEGAWRTGRTAALLRLLDGIDHVFCTAGDAIAERRRARANITAELGELGAASRASGEGLR